MKKKHTPTLENLRNENIAGEQSVWEYLKYKIRKLRNKEAARSRKLNPQL